MRTNKVEEMTMAEKKVLLAQCREFPAKELDARDRALLKELIEFLEWQTSLS